jgi:hypothetical protein
MSPLFDAGPPCVNACSLDLHDIVDCNDIVVQTCAPQACDPTTVTCADACTVASHTKRSTGCEFYAPHPEMDYPDMCFAAFVANTWTTPARIQVGNCSSGRHEMKSGAPFGLWVWGWGSPETTIDTKYVSYGYPAGMSVAPVNSVVIPPM